MQEKAGFFSPPVLLGDQDKRSGNTDAHACVLQGPTYQTHHLNQQAFCLSLFFSSLCSSRKFHKSCLGFVEVRGFF